MSPGKKDISSSRAMQAAVLRSIRADLDHVIAPRLVDPEARTAALLASEMLANLVAAETSFPALVDDSLAELRSLAGELRAQLADWTPPAAAAPQPTIASELFDSNELDAITATTAGLLADLFCAAGDRGIDRGIGGSTGRRSHRERG